MTLLILRDDALTATPGGFALRLNLPWIRSLPLSSLRDLEVTVDGEPTAAHVTTTDEWWFIQDRVVVSGDRMLSPGAHDVAVSFQLLIPYLRAGPDGPLVLPFRAERMLTLDAEASRVSIVEQAAPARDETPALPSGWTLTASAFNWTPDVIRAERDATDIAVGIVADGVADAIEVELGQLWRSFPEPADAEAEALRDALDAVGGRVSIVGASIDDWLGPAQRRDDDERLAFLLPQLHAASRLGAAGVRLPIGQAGPALLERLLPVLHDLDLTVYEEIQGQQTPDAVADPIATIAQLDDPHVRVLVDISMLMPSLPPTYLERMSALPQALLDRLSTAWRDPETHEAVVALLRSGGVPPQVHTLYMNLLIRFGRSDAADFRGILPLVGAFHLKFWDLDDTDGRVSQPIRDLGTELTRANWTGTLTSEWGGHEWLDDDPTEMTRAHLALARAALAAPQPSRL